MQLIKSAANPFFAMFILVVTLVGQLLTVLRTWGLVQESNYLKSLSAYLASHAQAVKEDQEKILQDKLATDIAKRKLSVWSLFGQLSQRRSRVQGYDQPLLRVHLQAFSDGIQRRAVLPQYIASTLIGLGLFGTFLGLIVTLKQVALLIGLFATTGNVDANDMMGQFFQKMSGPLAGMGEAFVASLLGLGGSIVNSIQLLALKRLQKHVGYLVETSYIRAAENIYGAPDHDQEGLPVAQDLRIAELQLQEISALRTDMHKQTDAVLMAASRMRQASEAIGQVLTHLERVSHQDDLRPQLEQMSAVVEQRLNLLVHKFEESQQAQHIRLGVAREMKDILRELTDKSSQMVIDLDQSTRHVSDLRSAVAEHATLLREDVRHLVSDLKLVLHADAQSVVAGLSEGARQQREQGAVLGEICTQMKATVEGVHSLRQSTQRTADQIKPQLVDLIARFERNDHAIQGVLEHDWHEINHKLNQIQIIVRGEHTKSD